MKHIVSFSGGKDSTAMLLNMIEKDMHIDKIVFADTTLEFPEMYEYIDRVEAHIGREITMVRPKKLFDAWFFGRITRGKLEGQIRGFPLVIFPCYWTREAKLAAFKRVSNKEDIWYIGISYEERRRLHFKYGQRYPLYEWKMTGPDCLEFLKKRDLVNPLYDNFRRTGCYLCPKQSLDSIKLTKKLYPKLFKKLLWYNERSPQPFSLKYDIRKV